MKMKSICLMLLCAGITLAGCGSNAKEQTTITPENIPVQQLLESAEDADTAILTADTAEGTEDTDTAILASDTTKGTEDTNTVTHYADPEDITDDDVMAATEEPENEMSDAPSDDLAATLLANSLMIEEDEPDLGEYSGIVDVWWNNHEESYVPGAEDTEITIYLCDTTERQKGFTLETGISSMVTGDRAIDIDNDGEDEYAVEAYFANTAAEMNLVYIFKQVDNKMVSIYPNKETEMMIDSAANTEFTTVEKDGQTLNALEVTTYGKEDGETIEEYHKTLVWNNGHWEEYK